MANFSLLYRNRNYRLIFLGQFVSFLGTMITGVALPYQIYHETHSTLMVGLLGLFQLLPLLITALLGGVLADKYHRRVLLLVSEFFLAIGCLLLAWNARMHLPHVWAIFVVASFMSAITGLHRPALEGISQQSIGKGDYASASQLTTLLFSVCMIAGPAIGGLIIAHFGIVMTYLVDFVSFLISFSALCLLGAISKPTAVQQESTWVSLKQGLHYAVTRQELLGTYFVDFIAMIFGMPTALFPAIAQSYGGVKVLGILYSAPAIGGVLVSVASDWTKRVKRHGVAIALAATFWGVAIIGFGLANNFIVAIIFLALAGGFDAISGIFRQVLWAETIDNKFRGRLAGIEMLSYLSGPKLGDTEAGLVAAAFGVTASIVSGGVMCVVGVIICSYLLPKFWKYQSNSNSELQ